jgi:hypothetical protein
MPKKWRAGLYRFMFWPPAGAKDYLKTFAG